MSESSKTSKLAFRTSSLFGELSVFHVIDQTLYLGLHPLDGVFTAMRATLIKVALRSSGIPEFEETDPRGSSLLLDRGVYLSVEVVCIGI